jgi:hypothetical protein
MDTGGEAVHWSQALEAIYQQLSDWQLGTRYRVLNY